MRKNLIEFEAAPRLALASWSAAAMTPLLPAF